MSVDIATPDLSAAEARALTERIRDTLRTGYSLITEAFQGRAWVALGYTSWDDYCAGEFCETRMVKIEREQRREIVGSMRSAGMSTRAIASGLGISKGTVSDDLTSTAQNRAVDRSATVTSLDGRQRPATASATNRRPGPEQLPRPARALGVAKSATVGDEVVNTATGEITPRAADTPTPQRRQRPLPDQFFDAAFDLNKCVERVARLAADDRFTRNAEQLAAKHRGELSRAVDALQGVLDRLTPATTRKDTHV